MWRGKEKEREEEGEGERREREERRGKESVRGGRRGRGKEAGGGVGEERRQEGKYRWREDGRESLQSLESVDIQFIDANTMKSTKVLNPRRNSNI